MQIRTLRNPAEGSSVSAATGQAGNHQDGPTDGPGGGVTGLRGTDAAARAVDPGDSRGQESVDSTSGWMSIRHPVSLAASRAFCPSRPIASESW